MVCGFRARSVEHGTCPLDTPLRSTLLERAHVLLQLLALSFQVGERLDHKERRILRWRDAFYSVNGLNGGGHRGLWLIGQFSSFLLPEPIQSEKNRLACSVSHKGSNPNHGSPSPSWAGTLAEIE